MNWLVEGLGRRQLQLEFGDGLKALVKLYYENYTDADRLDDDIVGALEMLVYQGNAGIHVETLVSEAEQELNNDGGVKGSDGKWHTVRTFKEDEDGD